MTKGCKGHDRREGEYLRMTELVDYYREGDKDGKYSTRVVMHV